jgi:hypothetical protein
MVRIALAVFAVICAAGAFLFERNHDLPNLLTLASNPDLTPWKLSQQGSGVSGDIVSLDGGFQANIKRSDGIDSHLQVFQDSAILKEGHRYRFTFTGKADKPRLITVKATKSAYTGSDFAGLGLQADFSLDTQWKQEETTFIAKGADGYVSRVPIIMLGAGGPGTVWMKDIALEEVD